MSQPFTSFQDFKRRYPIRPNDEGALLGSGTYGRVIKVEDQLETEWVAIKISEFKGSDTKSLRAEVELAQRVPRQANIARYDACYRLETDASVSDFAIMKYYADGNLADLFRREPLTSAQIYDITRGILLGLQHLHRHRIVHRDFKPANILISRDNAGRFIPKIADFGLSKLVSDDELDSSDFDLSDGRGTPSYKAPEQIEGSRVSFNLDLWAFGVILYEMLTGEKPFQADLRNNSEQSARREIEKKIILVELPARLNQLADPYRAIIRRCLVRDIHERARKEEELLDLLDAIPQRLTEAQSLLTQQKYKQALPLFEEVLSKREHHAEAQKGLEQCRSVLNDQCLTDLVQEAEAQLAQEQFGSAKQSYEQVLRINPAYPAAIRGLALCLERLRPEPLGVASLVLEATDIYQEGTDVYVAPFDATALQPIPSLRNAAVPVFQDAPTVPVPKVGPVPKPGLPQQMQVPQSRPFSWWLVAPLVAGLGGAVWYTTLNKPVVAATHRQLAPQPVLALAAPVTRTEGSAAELALTPSAEPEIVLKKRIDVALHKARQAYRQKEYDVVIMLTNSALQLDPGRRDVIALRDATVDLLKSKPDVSPENHLPAEAASAPPKALAAEPTEKEKRLKLQQQAQETYHQLLEEGIKAIISGNNKAKAIADFNQAQTLAKENDLNTAEADAAYATYLTKAKKIFDNEEYEGAKGWYNVAQALKDTPEVRAKIKQCSNQ